jgi:hypothetical protein
LIRHAFPLHQESVLTWSTNLDGKQLLYHGRSSRGGGGQWLSVFIVSIDVDDKTIIGIIDLALFAMIS